MAISKATAEIYKREIVTLEKRRKNNLFGIIFDFVVAAVFLILGIVWNINFIWVTTIGILGGIVCIVMYNVNGKKIENRQVAIREFKRQEREQSKTVIEELPAAEPIKQETQEVPQIEPDKPLTNESDKIKVLKEYKDLLDNGIITQEEFDKKKNEIL